MSQPERQSAQGGLRQVEIDALAVVSRVVFVCAVGNLDMQTTRRTSQQRQSDMGVQVGKEPCADQSHFDGEGSLPEFSAPRDIGLSPNVVDQEIEPSLLIIDPGHHLGDHLQL